MRDFVVKSTLDSISYLLLLAVVVVAVVVVGVVVGFFQYVLSKCCSIFSCIVCLCLYTLRFNCVSPTVSVWDMMSVEKEVERGFR